MLQIKLIWLYYYVCQLYSTQLRWQVQRFSSNHFAGQITDEELLTIYLFFVADQQKHPLKQMHTYIQNHWSDWFPTLPSYQTFVHRLNRLSDWLPLLVERLSEQLGCKRHLIGATRPQTLPIPQQDGLTPASIHDLTALRPVLPQFDHTTIPADTAYIDQPLKERLQRERNTCMLTPVKQVKDQCKSLQQFDHVHDALFFRAISAQKQPLESFFNFLQQKTNIQIASKVRSSAGLIGHTLAN